MGADAANQFTKLYFVPGEYHFGGPHAAKIGGDNCALGVSKPRIGNRPSLLSIWTGTGIPAFTTEPHMSTCDPELRTKMNRQVYFSAGAKEVLL